MGNDLTVMDLRTQEAQKIFRKLGSRPVVNKRTGQVYIDTGRGLRLNSALRKDEWEELDRRVVQAAVTPLRIVNRLNSMGMVRRLGSIGTLVAQYNQISEMTAAEANLRGHSAGEKDLIDFDLVGVPVPVIFKEFELDERYLAASRQMGDSVDMSNGAAAARVVSEKAEDMLINGDTSIGLNGTTIYGLTNHPQRNTDTASNFGGGDWGTIGNIVPTIAGMIAAAKNDGYYGPYGIWVATTQFNQAAHNFYTDGSGESAYNRVMRLPNISFFEESPDLDDGEVVLVHLSQEVVELAYVEAYWPITNLEWTSGDMMLNSFKALTVFTPIVKSDYSGRSGVVHATGA